MVSTAHIVVIVPTMMLVTHIVARDIFKGGRLNSVSNEAENGTYPEKDREAPEKLFAELHPLWGRFGRRQFVPSVPLKDYPCPLRCQTLEEVKQSSITY